MHAGLQRSPALSRRFVDALFSPVANADAVSYTVGYVALCRY